MDVTALGVEEVSRAVERGSLEEREAVDACRGRIEQNEHLNAFVELSTEPYSQGEGRLRGVPIAVKDCFVDRNRVPTMGSLVTAEWLLGTAEVIRRLRAEGAAVIGYTNLHEWAIGTTSAITATGPILNPHDPTRIAGGSSGGSAAALAAGMAAGAVGTDAGGSIRVPSACCGVVGLKPSWGAVPIEGWAQTECVVDHIGPMARSVGDVRTLFEVMADRPTQTIDTGSIKIGVARNFFDDMDPGFEAALGRAVDALGGRAAEVRDVTVSQAECATYAVGFLLLPHLARLLGSRVRDPASGFHPLTKSLLEVGAAIAALPSACSRPHPKAILAMRRLMSTRAFLDFPKLPAPVRNRVGKHFTSERQGELGRALVMQGWSDAFDRVDVIVTPTIPAPPPRFDDLNFRVPSGPKGTDKALLPLNGPMNLAGIPTLTMPVGGPHDFPASISLSARHGSDDLVLSVGEVLERELGLEPRLAS